MSEYWTGVRVPGHPASAWWPRHKRITTVTSVVALGAGVAALVLDERWLWIVAGAVVLLGVMPLMYWSLRGFPNEQAEVAAGYTTLPNRHREVAQVDAKDWRIIRAAGAPFPPAASKST